MKKISKEKFIIITLALVCGFLLFVILSVNGVFSRHGTAVSEYVPQTRTYYIAAENVIWDYAPAGKDPFTNAPLPDPWGKQTKYNKVRYIEYTDDTFTVKKTQPVWLGILGPVIRGVEGDTIKVDFYNKADKPYSMHPHGVHYDKDNEGAAMAMNMPGMGMDMGSDVKMPSPTSMPLINDNDLEGKGAKVMPGEKYTYTWTVLPDAAPQDGQGGSKVWWYHSHVDPTQDIYDGLLGPIIITSAKYANLDATPNDVDKEFVTMFMIFDESKPGMNADQIEASTKHTINGYFFDNLPGLVMNKGDKVRWYVLGMGNEVDLHTPHWHGEVVLDRQTNVYTDVVELLPGSMKTVDMVADNPGTWMYHCHVADHVKGGMMAMYTIKP